MPNNPFFIKETNISLKKIFYSLGIKQNKINSIINDIKDLELAKTKDISFYNSLKYENLLKKTKAKFILTEKKYQKLVSNYAYPVMVDNVFKAVSIVTHLFYPKSHLDAVDFSVKKPELKKYKNVKFGSNVLLWNNVKIGKNTVVGHNTIIESNVIIGKECVIGSNILIKNTYIGNSVRILDGTIIGKKGFGFFPDSNKNIRYPHIGMVVVEDNVEIGCNNTIDRGSISNTVIGKNTFIDNQVHIAHNVKIGKNCIITGQVGFAGSSILGNNVQIGGQAGVSGHVKIGNNVRIGGGSGVLKNIPDNSKVMGYPAKDIRKFLKDI